jgi:DNA-binding Lrp family transcriptional regulator
MIFEQSRQIVVLEKQIYALGQATCFEEGTLEAFILLNVEAGVLGQVLESVFKIDGVKTAYGVTGQFDAVVLAQFSDLDNLGQVIKKIHHVKGVLRTQTLVTIPMPVGTGSVTPNLSEEEKTGPNNYPDK